MNMRTTIEPYDARHLEGVVQLSLRAWEPVFVSIRATMPPDLYREFYPDEWRVSQQQAVEHVCGSSAMHVWVALNGAETPVGFVALKVHEADKMGEIYMIAVDPEHQGRGIASALTEFALEWMKNAGMILAMVETGTDPGHGPARKTYEKMGFGLWPVARYFKKL